jgi:hypothetical protein
MFRSQVELGFSLAHGFALPFHLYLNINCKPGQVSARRVVQPCASLGHRVKI